MNEPSADQRTCACRFTDAYDCWSSRYPSPDLQTAKEIEMDGGPCSCACHEEYCDPAEFL